LAYTAPLYIAPTAAVHIENLAVIESYTGTLDAFLTQKFNNPCFAIAVHSNITTGGLPFGPKIFLSRSDSNISIMRSISFKSICFA
jgi:hypothetical protein